jgi:predicted phosphoribosyltransferase
MSPPNKFYRNFTQTSDEQVVELLRELAPPAAD